MDTDLYRVGRLLYQGIPAYTRVDARLGWTFGENLELSFVGQNLLNARHPEFISNEGGTLPTQSKRGGYVKLTWRF